MNNDIELIKTTLEQAKQEVAKVIIGQEEAVKLALVAILTNNHVLIEGVPGVAKTLLVRTIACVLGCEFGRIQFTPDLMPADITGTHIFNLVKNEFSLVKGPIFTTFLLADEINRAPAKTQAALLQAMQEKTVTIDRTTHVLSDNFTVFATQNPIEFEGTYPLPEAQKDRFMLKINMNPPNKEEELKLALSTLSESSPINILEKGQVNPVVNHELLSQIRKELINITIQNELVGYAVDIVRKTRQHESILVGAGPRATQALILGARALAITEERDFVIPDDIKYMIFPVLEHRLILRPEYEIEGLSIKEVINDILQNVSIPR
ncbi:MAG: MoxR family ATPase [Desulfobacterales bacterium]|nr:MoxR family ATPase [Desulfobacterales bacterium]